MKKYYYTRSENFDETVFLKAFEFLLEKSNSQADESELFLILTQFSSSIYKLKNLFLTYLHNQQLNKSLE